MKQDKYMLWWSFGILIVSIILFIILDGPKKKEQDVTQVATTNQIASHDNAPDLQASSTRERFGSTSPQEPDARFNTKLWSATYKNDTYGFTLVFPDSWGSYRAKEVEHGVQFGVEDQDDVFTIVANTKKEWDEKVAESKKAGGKALPGVIKKNDTYVFTIERADQFSEKVIAIISVYPSILTTFTLHKP